MCDRDDEFTEVVATLEALQSGRWTLSDLRLWMRLMSDSDLMQRLLDRVSMNVPEETREMLVAFRAERPFSPVDGILDSMTPWEREHPEPLDASRYARIARGSGVDVGEVERFLTDSVRLLEGVKDRFPAELGVECHSVPRWEKWAEKLWWFRKAE